MENRFTAGADDIPRSEAGDEIARRLRNSETCISIIRDMHVSDKVMARVKSAMSDY